MKKTAFMIVYNDADYVDYAIRSIKDWVDEFIVVEGAFEITMETGSPARSNDGTLDILQKYVDSGDIILRQVNLREHKHHYDVGYQYAIENGSDWAILVDSDEIWTKPAQILAESYMKRWVHEPAYEMRVQEYSFVNDFWHHYPASYPRIFKCTKESKFVFDNEVQFANTQRGQHPVFMIPGKNIFHFGYVRRRKRWKLKQDYMWLKDFNPLNKQYKLEGDTYVLPDDIPIYKFTGKHPDIMHDHPFYDMTANQIIYGEEK